MRTVPEASGGEEAAEDTGEVAEDDPELRGHQHGAAQLRRSAHTQSPLHCHATNCIATMPSNLQVGSSI